MGKNGKPVEVVFLVPTAKFDSVTFVTMQYVIALRARGIAAYICSVRPSRVVLQNELVAPRRALLSCDVVVTGLFVPDIVGWILKCLRRRVRWVAFLHCNITAGMAGERKFLAHQRVALWLWALRQAETIIAPSQYAARSFKGMPQVILLPHCIVPEIENDFRRLAGAAPTTARVPAATPASGAPAYVFIGRDTPIKRLRSVLRLLRLDPAARVRIVTELSFSKAAVAALPPAESARCDVIGFSSDPYAHVGADDIVVCPSGREGFGMVPLECLSRGIAFAPINEGAFREYWADTPLCYSRIEQLPALASRAVGNDSVTPLRDQFIGKAALDARIDILLPTLTGQPRGE
jgi:glycosyltransferase involved in cell wall biosynthesis